MRRPAVAFGLSLLLAVPAVHSEKLPGIDFRHADWQLVCDNTRTCRAAGYSDENDDLPVSVLLTRKAGPDEDVAGELMIGKYGDNAAADRLPKRARLELRIDGRPQGTTLVEQASLTGKLDRRQVAALVAALARDSEITWTHRDDVWQLSDKGAAAVLLKMDEFQGRIGTRGALLKKGPRGDDGVLPPLPPPVVRAAPFAAPRAADAQIVAKRSKALIKALRGTLRADDWCPDLTEPEPDGDAETTLSVTRVSDTRLLASMRCWRGAYNVGFGFWLISDSAGFDPVLVTTSGSDLVDSGISATHKGRGLGDCWASEGWTWDGRQFVHTESSTTGLCRLLAPGGAWELPRIVTDLRSPAR